MCNECFKNKIQLDMTFEATLLEGRQIKFYNIPTLQCQICGERFLADEISRQIENMAEKVRCYHKGFCVVEINYQDNVVDGQLSEVSIEREALVGGLHKLYRQLEQVQDAYPAFVRGIVRYASTSKRRKELERYLWDVSDSYFGFRRAVLNYVCTEERMDVVLTYIKQHKDANTSDILEFISNQADFFDMEE